MKKILAALAIPLSVNTDWTELKFSNLPANQVTYSEQGISVQVQKSASPLVYKLSTPIELSSIEFEILVDGELNLQSEGTFPDDSYFRLGLVLEGDKKLSGVKKLFAADWVKKLFSLAPAGVGLDRILFLHVAPSNAKLGQSRVHPKSDLMEERIIVLKNKDVKDIKYSEKLMLNRKVHALWLSIDGDDTKSEFKTTIKKINLNGGDL